MQAEGGAYLSAGERPSKDNDPLAGGTSTTQPEMSLIQPR